MKIERDRKALNSARHKAKETKILCDKESEAHLRFWCVGHNNSPIVGSNCRNKSYFRHSEEHLLRERRRRNFNQAIYPFARNNDKIDKKIIIREI